MRIDPKIPAADSSSTGRVTDAQSGVAKSSHTSSASGPSDTFQLSSGQATITQLTAQLSQIPDVRQEKVNVLSNEIQSGNFRRSSEQVAGAVVTQLF
jgi:flagellar biosynthesis anti-sigma factor FlgM